MAAGLAQTIVRKRVESLMLQRIRILRGARGALDPATGRVGGLTGATVIYSGKARIWTVRGAGVLTVGEDQIPVRETRISIPIDSPMPRRDDLVQVLDDSVADPDLTGRVLRITDVDGGSFFGDARRMSAVAVAESRHRSAR